MFPNPVSARCLAVLSTSTTDAWTYYKIAWDALKSTATELATRKYEDILLQQVRTICYIYTVYIKLLTI